MSVRPRPPQPMNPIPSFAGASAVLPTRGKGIAPSVGARSRAASPPQPKSPLAVFFKNFRRRMNCLLASNGAVGVTMAPGISFKLLEGIRHEKHFVSTSLFLARDRFCRHGADGV